MSIIKSSKLEECEFVRLYNFKRKVNFVDKFIQPVQKYILYPTQRSYVNRDLYTCKNYDKRRSGIYEMSRADKEYASKNVFCKKFGISVDDAKNIEAA